MGCSAAEIAGYEAANRAIMGNETIPVVRLTPSRAAKRKWAEEWSLFIAGWKKRMDDKIRVDTKWVQESESNGHGKKHLPNPAQKAPPKPSIKRARMTSGDPEEDSGEIARESEIPPKYIGRGSEWKRGYDDFRQCAIDRHCSPQSDETWDEYMEGWDTAISDWESRFFPEKVRVQIRKTATITDAETKEDFHLQDTSVVVGEQLNANGLIEFVYNGVLYTVYLGKNVVIVR